MQKMRIEKRCICCNKLHTVEIGKDAYIAWKGGQHIQDIAPELSIDERELLISGVCGHCFDAMFEDEC